MKKSAIFEKYIDNTKRCFYLSNLVVSQLKIKKHDKIAVEIQNFVFPAIISSHLTNSGESYSINIPNSIRRKVNKKTSKIKITKLKKITNQRNGKNLINIADINKFYKTITCTNWIYKNQIVLWNKGINHRNYFPIITNNKIKIDKKLLIYLGLYFADGNKSENTTYKIPTATREMYRIVIDNYYSLLQAHN